MFPPASEYPDGPALTAALSAVFGGPVAVSARERNMLASTYPSEVVSCRLPDGTDLRVFCKYEAERARHRDGGHHGGVGYEALVYREVLRPAGVSAPRYLGEYPDPRTGGTWLFMEYVAGATRVSKCPRPPLTLAARWLGGFHRIFDGRPAPGLRRHDVGYYRGWARRASAAARPWADRFPWVGDLCERFAGEAAGTLADAPATVVHGELYSSNVLVRGDTVCPVDWESAAVGPGETDLASLTEAWPAAVATECERAYVEARWPAGPPAGFRKRLAAARLYWALRWLGDALAGGDGDKHRRYFAHLRAAGKDLGFVGGEGPRPERAES